MQASAARPETGTYPQPLLPRCPAGPSVRQKQMQSNRTHKWSAARDWPLGDLPETYFLVLDFGPLGIVFDETEPGFSYKECCEKIASQDHAGRPVAVYRASEGHFDDVSEDIARQALKMLLEGPWLFEKGSDAPHQLPEFICCHCAEANALLWEAIREGRMQSD